MDIVFLEDLRIETIIGIYDWERETRQIVSLDLEMGVDTRPAAMSDSIVDALDYKGVAKRLISFIADSKFQLLETLAERVAETLMSEFDIGWVKIRVSKPGAISGSRNVGVCIERGTWNSKQ